MEKPQVPQSRVGTRSPATPERGAHPREDEAPDFLDADRLPRCPDGKSRAIYYKVVNGVVEELSIQEGELPPAEFRITGDYETFAKISCAELGARAALMSGKLKLQGNMVKALSLASIVDRLNKVLASIPTEF